jgi:hypothetical protein
LLIYNYDNISPLFLTDSLISRPSSSISTL